jgi:hypothetical protein
MIGRGKLFLTTAQGKIIFEFLRYNLAITKILKVVKVVKSSKNNYLVGFNPVAEPSKDNRGP